MMLVNLILLWVQRGCLAHGPIQSFSHCPYPSPRSRDSWTLARLMSNISWLMGFYEEGYGARSGSDTFGLCWDRSSSCRQYELPADNKRSDNTAAFGNDGPSLFTCPGGAAIISPTWIDKSDGYYCMLSKNDALSMVKLEPMYVLRCESQILLINKLLVVLNATLRPNKLSCPPQSNTNGNNKIFLLQTTFIIMYWICTCTFNLFQIPLFVVLVLHVWSCLHLSVFLQKYHK